MGGRKINEFFCDDFKNEYQKKSPSGTLLYGTHMVKVEIDPEKWILRITNFESDLPVSLSEITKDSPVHTFPNPVEDYIYFELEIKKIANKNIVILNFEPTKVTHLKTNRDPNSTSSGYLTENEIIKLGTRKGVLSHKELIFNNNEKYINYSKK